MTTYLVSCPDCGSRIEVDRQTMRATTTVVGSATGLNADAPHIVGHPKTDYSSVTWSDPEDAA